MISDAVRSVLPFLLGVTGIGTASFLLWLLYVDICCRSPALPNDYACVEEGKVSLEAERAEVKRQAASEVPNSIRTYRAQRLEAELGLVAFDFADLYFPSFVFQYVSPGGNASLTNNVTMDLDNLEEMVAYLAGRIAWEKSARRQRALMTRKLRDEILDRDGYTCRACGVSVADEPHLLLEVDHIVPVSAGGLTTKDNLQTLCWRCNRSKGAKVGVAPASATKPTGDGEG